MELPLLLLAVEAIIGRRPPRLKRNLPRYVAEFDFRYNTRDMKVSERVIETVMRGRGKRLMYHELSTRNDRVVSLGRVYCSEHHDHRLTILHARCQRIESRSRQNETRCHHH